jgi:hypothetical protein
MRTTYIFLAIIVLSISVTMCTARPEPRSIALPCTQEASVSLSPNKSTTNAILELDGCGCIRSITLTGAIGQCVYIGGGAGQLDTDARGDIWVSTLFRKILLVREPSGQVKRIEGFGGQSYPLTVAASTHGAGTWFIGSDRADVGYVDLTGKLRRAFHLKDQPFDLSSQGDSAFVLLVTGGVQRVRFSGRVETLYTTPRHTFRGIAPSADGSVWFFGPHVVALMSRNGSTRHYSCDECSLERGVSSVDGSLWATDPLRHTVIRIQRDGALSRTDLGTTREELGDITATADGSVWVVAGTNHILVIERREQGWRG